MLRECVCCVCVSHEIFIHGKKSISSKCRRYDDDLMEAFLLSSSSSVGGTMITHTHRVRVLLLKRRSCEVVRTKISNFHKKIV